ncbi:MAG: membrane protein insertase YidC [Alloprevotella sp.]|nr:membrane protein insertase YidC [Alloprevotella sp.]
MDKNTVIGLILIVLVFIGFSYWNAPRPDNTLASEQTEQVESDALPASSDSLQASTEAKVDSTDIFLPATQGDDTPIILQNDKVAVKFSAKGGHISEVRLKNYKSYQDFADQKDTDLILFDENTADWNLAFETQAGIYNTSDYYFTPVAQTDSTLTLSLTSVEGDSLLLSYKLLPNTYLVNASVRAVGKQFKGKELLIGWKDQVRQLEKGLKFENQYSTLTYKDTENGTKKLNELKADTKDNITSANWIAFKNQYFSAIMISGNKPFQDVTLQSDTCGKGSGFVKRYAAEFALPYDNAGKDATTFQYYFGPNQYLYLKSMEQFRLSGSKLELQSLVYLGWPIVRWINRFFTIYIFDFLTGVGLNMGIVLLLITLLLRVIVYPATRKSFLSSAKMRVLKPKVDEISKKYPNQEDALKRQQEIQQLYSQYGTSPMGGCLPMLIQMPIWIAMFNFVPNAFELRQQSFLWAEDLSTYDDILSWGSDIWLIGDHLSLFCVLFCATNLLYSWMTMRQQKETLSGDQAQQMKMMQWMMLLMPLFFFFMFNEYSSGLNYYYFISLLVTAITMWYLRRTTDDKKLLAQLEENYKANKEDPNRKPSGLAARLQALQEQQEELKKRQQNLGRRN